MNTPGTEKVLEEAIRFETEGRNFFLEAAEKATTYFSRTIFRVLAEQELNHIEKVKEAYRRTMASEREVFTPSPDPPNELETVFQQAKRETDPATLERIGELEAVRLAIELEAKGHDFYDRLARQAITESERGFYRWLAEEESVHFSVLRRMEEVLLGGTSLE